MLKLETKPKNVKEAIETGWMTAKEIYEAAGVSDTTFENFLKVVRNATLQKPNSVCPIDGTSRKCITGAHNTKYYHPDVMKAFQLWLMRNQVNQGVQVTIKDSLRTVSDVDGFKYSKEDICNSCKVSETTFKNFLAGQPVDQRNFISVGSSHKKLYNETVLKAFQLWLMRNQANQGKSSQVVKETAKQSLEFGLTAKVVIGSGDVEAANEFAKLIVQATQNQKDLLEQQQQNHQLKLENQTMKTTLQYDKVKGWHRWSDLKRDWKPYSDRLKNSNKETIFYEAGLEYGKDYEEITFNGYEFPTCMVSPTAVPILMNYLNISIS